MEVNLTITQQISRMDWDRLKAYRENLDFYNGLQWQGYSRRRERRLVFNYAKVFAEKITSYLMSELNFAIEPLDSSLEARERAQMAEQALRQIYEENNLEQLDFDTELDAAVLGDGCFKVTWDGQERRVRVSAPDVQGLFVWWLGDDVAQVWRVASRYRLAADEVQQLYQVKRNKETTVAEVWTAEDFQLWLDDELLEHKSNPYGFIPFIIYPKILPGSALSFGLPK